MRRPLVITDCDEVLLRMIVHFRDWLDEAHDVVFDTARGFGDSMRRRGLEAPLPADEVWALLNGFFDSQMHRQDEVPGAVAAIAALKDHADVVVLTNLHDFRREARGAQLAALGFDCPIYTNQGPKGPALQRILAEHGAGDGAGDGTRAVFFIDDLVQHHGSVAESAPHVTRLHFVGEPAIAPHIDCAFRAGHAHARIDDWQQALPWILERIKGNYDG